MSHHQAGVGGKGCREDDGQEVDLVYSSGGHGVQAHGGGSRFGLFQQECGYQGLGQVGEQEQKHTPPTLFHQAALPGVLSLPQVVAETLSFKQAQLEGYNQSRTLFLSASIL